MSQAANMASLSWHYEPYKHFDTTKHREVTSPRPGDIVSVIVTQHSAVSHTTTAFHYLKSYRFFCALLLAATVSCLATVFCLRSGLSIVLHDMLLYFACA